MASSCNLLHIIFFSIFVSAFCCNAKPKNSGTFQGIFIFGSSVIDSGNNNNVVTTVAKANYSPYGIDFPTGSSGRFSNGKNVGDFVAERLGLPLIPAFADPQTNGAAIIHGVNYGSGGSGILDETGLVVGTVTTLNQQIGNFEGVTLPELEAQFGCGRTRILPQYLFMIAAGNNDYLINYFLLGQATMTPQDFAVKLVTVYADQLKRLYDLGARNLLLLSVYPLGCSPVVSRGMGCLSRPNEIVTMFYDQLISKMNEIKSQMPGSQINVVNSVKIITDIINNAASGFSNVTGSCCELAMNGVSCRDTGNVCEDRSSYIYFDGQHNTEAFSRVFAEKACSSLDKPKVNPVNFRKLIHAHL